MPRSGEVGHRDAERINPRTGRRETVTTTGTRGARPPAGWRWMGPWYRATEDKGQVER